MSANWNPRFRSQAKDGKAVHFEIENGKRSPRPRKLARFNGCTVPIQVRVTDATKDRPMFLGHLHCRSAALHLRNLAGLSHMGGT